MEIVKDSIDGLVTIHPSVFKDERGYFFESFNKIDFRNFVCDTNFVQDNESMSMKNVLRGLHFQKPPHMQGKLVRIIKGAVLDVVVDLRKASKSYGQYKKIILTASDKIQFWIPPGFAHGFYTLEDETIFAYKCTEYYNPESEVCILWNDELLNINWGVNEPFVSKKDSNGISFRGFSSPF